MKKNHSSVFISLIILFIALCAKTVSSQPKDYYMLKALPIPVHTQAKQMFTSIGYDGGIDINLSYSLPRDIFIFATGNINPFSSSRKEDVGARYKIFKNDYAATIGLGGFKYSKYNFFNAFEYSGGIGLSKIDSYWRYVPDALEVADMFTDALYQTAFVQVNGTKVFSKIHLGAATRIAVNRYGTLKYFTRSQANITSNSNSFATIVLEPALSFSYLISMFRGNFQLGVSVPVYTQGATMVSTSFPSEVESYGEFYFFWRIAIQRLKNKN
ncbi:MAG: hypothetical protein PHS05_11525 [Bacteroidales bacterium]|nr:hypothetical protein [Bacteroidales bacterium]